MGRKYLILNLVLLVFVDRECFHSSNDTHFFLLTRVNPGQPIWPVTRSLDRVDDRVGFQNYGCETGFGDAEQQWSGTACGGVPIVARVWKESNGETVEDNELTISIERSWWCNGFMDKKAEEFIEKFYKELRQQKRTSG